MNPLILYQNNLLNASLTSSGTAAGYDIQNVKDYRPNTFWKAASGGTNYITMFNSAGAVADSAAFVSHNLGNLNATVYVEGSNDNASWTPLATKAVTDNNAQMLKFNTVNFIYFRFRIITALGAPYLGTLFIGQSFQFEYPPAKPITPFTKAINADAYESKAGNPLGASIRFNSYEISHTFNDFTADWYNNYYDPFMTNHAELLKPFFYAIDLDARPDEVFYLMLKQSNARADQYERKDYYSTITLNAMGRR